MNINRHNYETFFLLYVDNELSAVERNALELFVQENADLQEELDMLQQTAIEPEPIVFKGKSGLFKTEKISVSAEEKLLLYIDNELDAAQGKEVQLMLGADSSIAAELKLLLQTKLPLESDIFFADKPSLYRKEKDNVVPFGWWKLAAAAIFIGFGIWGTAVYVNGRNAAAGDATAIKNSTKKINDIKRSPVQLPAAQQNIPAKPVVAEEEIATVSPSLKAIGKNVLPSAQPTIKTKTTTASIQEEKAIAVQQKEKKERSNNLPEPYFESVDKSAVNTIATTVTPQAQHNVISNISTTDNKAKDQNNANNNAHTVAFTDNNDDKFTFSDDDTKKSKRTGFFRKLKRVVERNTKTEDGDDNLKVANLAFATH